MTDPLSQAHTAISADDLARRSTFAQSDDQNLPHIGLVGDTYTILVAGKDTHGRYCLIEMHIPAGGGQPLTNSKTRAATLRDCYARVRQQDRKSFSRK
jgi:hypothetical protein